MSEYETPHPTNEELVAAAYYPARQSKDVGFPVDHDPPPNPGWAGSEHKGKAASAPTPVVEPEPVVVSEPAAEPTVVEEKSLEAEKPKSYKTRQAKAE